MALMRLAKNTVTEPGQNDFHVEEERSVRHHDEVVQEFVAIILDSYRRLMRLELDQSTHAVLVRNQMLS